MKGVAGLIAIFIGFLLALRNMSNEVPKSDFRALYKKWGERFNVEPTLLNAIAIVESSENPNAVNPADPSIGLMQILCDADCETCSCKNRFNIQDWPLATPERLKEPDFNIKMGAQILSWNIRKYGLPKGIAVYNAFSARFDPDNGPFRNQSYVDKVIKAWNTVR